MDGIGFLFAKALHIDCPVVRAVFLHCYREHGAEDDEADHDAEAAIEFSFVHNHEYLMVNIIIICKTSGCAFHK